MVNSSDQRVTLQFGTEVAVFVPAAIAIPGSWTIHSPAMRIRTAASFLFLVMLSVVVTAKEAKPATSLEYQPGEFLKQWLVLKPVPSTTGNGKAPDEERQKQTFAWDWLLEEGGEANIHPLVGTKAKIAEHSLKWTSLESQNGVVVVASDAHPMNYAITYAWTEFTTSLIKPAYLSIGSDDGVKVWLNGKLVLEHWVSRPVRIDDDLVPIELQAGRNQLLMKVYNDVGPAGFACRILSEEQIRGLKNFREDLGTSRFLPLNDSEIKTMLRDNIEADKETVGLVVGIVDEHGPRVVSHGKLDNGTDHEVDGDTLFGIGSITKVFTALLLQDMIERGEMKLEDPVQKYLPNSVKMPTYQGKEITLLHLATHTSGLPRDDDGQTYAFLNHYTLHQAPGTRLEYSNLGMGLLGHVIALKAGQDYETLVLERICRPLGMESTRITLPPELKSRLAAGHAMPGRRVKGFSTERQEMDPRVPNLLGAGALYSTANDLLKFVSAYAGITPSPLSFLMRKAEELHVIESGDRRPLVWFREGSLFEHGGLVEGYQAELAFDLQKRRGIVVLSNCANHSTLVSGIWRPLMKGRSPKPSALAPIDPANYDRYTGLYISDDGVMWVVRRRVDRLTIQWIGNLEQRVHTPSFEVFPESESVFANDFWEQLAIFLISPTGQPPKLILIDSNGEGAVELSRVSTDTPEPPAPVHLDPHLYDDYSGQYRKALLLGLVHVGPTLSISHETDEVGSHLMARVLGLPGYGRGEIFPRTENSFIPSPTTSEDFRFTFTQNKKGETTHVLVDWNGTRIRGRRISTQPAK
jgi:CubicO group peptidase (beta-lactamase class C family)